MTNIQQPIKEYIAKEFLFGEPLDTLADDEPLIRGGVIDSLGIFLLIAFMEKEFEIKIDPAEVVLENFETVNAITRLVTTKMAAKMASS